MTRFLLLLLTASSLALPAAAQTAPEIAFDAVTNPLVLPDDIYLGEVGGVATNSKGDIFVYTRTGHPTASLGGARAFAHGGSRLFQFDRTGKFVREIGKDSYAFMFAQQVRIDPQDNIWIVEQMTNTVLKFDPEGSVVMILGRKAEAIPVPARGPGAGGVPNPPPAANELPGAGIPSDLFNRPTDVAFDATGNVYVADSRNKRIQVFDSNGAFKSQITNVGSPQALCITPGPNQVLYSSNSNPPNDIDVAGEIYKLKLDGTVIGKFGKAGRLPKEFNFVNAIDCRNENGLLVGEIGNLRVQKIALH